MHDTHEVKIWRKQHKTPNQMSGKERGGIILKKDKKYSINGVQVIRTAGNDYRVVYVSLIVAAGVAEVVWTILYGASRSS